MSVRCFRIVSLFQIERMRGVMKSRIAYKLIVWVGSALALFGVLYLWGTVRQMESDYLAEVKRGGIRLGDAIKKSFRYAMLQDDKTAVNSAVKAVGRQKEIAGIRIFNKDGVVVFSSDGKNIGERVDLQAESCRPCHQHNKPLRNLSDMERCNIYKPPGKERELIMINPIYNGPDCSTAACHVHRPEQRVLGVMDLSLSLGIYDAESKRRKLHFTLFVFGLFAILSLVIYIFTRRVVSKPIAELVEGTRKIADGDMDYILEAKSNDEIGMLAKSFNKMTESLRRTRSQLLQSERLASLGRMAAGIAHEINNPLTGIMMFASTTQQEEGIDAEVRENMEVILDETRRCREIIKGLLDFSRQRQSNFQMVQINALISESAKIITGQCQAHHIRLKLDLDRQVPVMMLDAVQIKQVILNLMINAMDAMPEGGDLHVTTRLDADESVIVEVADTGRGIPQSELPKIFEPFYSTKGAKGTGLGLAVSWGIIQQHGGKISVKSEVGKGTVFTVRLPVKKGKK